ncbi:YihY/virulence factor BrkB family protein [Sulfitobacter sp. S190]|uniref:YihY/virulence factor BrkB family protein n=1 Tax=Sulfitobacter sp. S190 TaxID=2867022 RepID=UPI0021A887D1|nr:YihY/virulence factor BrkB family protein [Sulfitobacter sp. S190]UWR21741.1 YihY/virulence factor BrkB family protein [Sulfitobacter sp. S190]
MARGRTAETPSEIPMKGWKDIAWRVKDEIAADHVSLIAAGVAFYGLLALFPAITAVMALGGLLVQPPQIVSMMQQLEGVVPAEVLNIITKQAEEVAGSREGGLGLTVVFGILLAIYSASKGVGSLMEGMNVAYDEEETRGFFTLNAVKLALTVLAIVCAIIGLIAIGGLPTVIGLEETSVVMDWALGAVALVLVAALTLLALSLFYRYGPSRDDAEWRWLTPGAVAACVVWAAGSAGFAFYVANFGTYNETFGALAGVIVLLMWMWLSAFIIMLGAELNAEMEAQTRHDTTVGGEEPMGERDAVKADNLGEATV